MGIQTADALVLRQYAFRETSLIVTCLTPTHGKLKGLIKGIRGPRSKYRSAMEPLTLNRIVFYETRTSSLHLISQCGLLEPLTELQQELERVKLAAFCVELTDVTTELEEPQALIFAYLLRTLRELTGLTSAADLSALRLHFILRTLRLTGFRPQLNECASCGKSSALQGYWSASQGGLLCQACLYHDPSANELQPAVLEALIHCAESDDRPVLHPAHAVVITKLLNDFMHWRLDRPLKTMRSLS